MGCDSVCQSAHSRLPPAPTAVRAPVCTSLSSRSPCGCCFWKALAGHSSPQDHNMGWPWPQQEQGLTATHQHKRSPPVTSLGTCAREGETGSTLWKEARWKCTVLWWSKNCTASNRHSVGLKLQTSRNNERRKKVQNECNRPCGICIQSKNKTTYIGMRAIEICILGYRDWREKHTRT